jgi:isoleucyl-tRNA synthetase
LVVCSDKNVLSAVESLGAYVSKELNAKKLTLVSDEDKWCNAKVMPNSNVLGKKLGKAFGPLRKAFAKLSIEEVADLKAKSLLGAVNIGGQALEPSDLVFMLQPKFDAETYEGLASADGRFMILIDITKDESIILEACSREMTNRVQKLRKSTGLQVADKVTAYVSDNGGDGSVFKALQMFKDGVRKQIGLPLYPASFRPKYGTQIGVDTFKYGKGEVSVELVVPGPTMCPDEALMASCKGDKSLVEKVNAFVSTMGLETLGSLDTLTATVDKEEVTLKKGEHYFMSVEEMVAVHHKGSGWD